MSRPKCSNFHKVVEVLDSECEACAELMQIRALILTNFGKNDNSYGFLIKDEGTTHDMVLSVLECLVPDGGGGMPPESRDKIFMVRYLDNYGKADKQTVRAPTEAHAKVMFNRTGISYKEILKIELIRE